MNRFLLFLLFYFCCISLITNCTTNNSNYPKEEWIKKDTSNFPQILLTNDYFFQGDRSSSGASAFLLEFNNDTFACTAKHLLSDAMGIEPTIPTDSVNKLLISWEMYPRKNRISNDTIKVTSILTEEKNEDDIILLNINKLKHNIQPLKPYFGILKKGQKLKIIGCEYQDRDCHQQFYDATFYNKESNNLLLIIPEKKFAASGFSGAPVIDENGYVVGILTSSATIIGKEILILQSIESLKKLRKN